eukprot:GHVU01157245.1.p1 GENE.GHVU01157245.1~~GHVU01157245.1.p1  ORF type:complete len:279 (-),score=39.23 GHVU01157245.1:265-1101(-)
MDSEEGPGAVGGCKESAAVAGTGQMGSPTTAATAIAKAAIEAEAEVGENSIDAMLRVCNGAADVLFQGAEARVYRTTVVGKEAVLKHRFPKRYRHPTMDASICWTRTVNEARNMFKCRSAGVESPVVYAVDQATNSILMQYIHGRTMKATTDDSVTPEATLRTLEQHIGADIARMHGGADVVHGDLTTSNILVTASSTGSLIPVFIDFGLSCVSTAVEDKAVDLYVLERSIQSTHVTRAGMFERILEGYQMAAPKAARPVIKRLAEVRLRGRKRSMVG